MKVIKESLTTYLERKSLDVIFVQPVHHNWKRQPGQIGDNSSLEGLVQSSANLSRGLGPKLAVKAFDAISSMAQQLGSGLIDISIPIEQQRYLWGPNLGFDPDYTKKRNALEAVVADTLMHATDSPYKDGRVQIGNHETFIPTAEPGNNM